MAKEPRKNNLQIAERLKDINKSSSWDDFEAYACSNELFDNGFSLSIASGVDGKWLNDQLTAGELRHSIKLDDAVRYCQTNNTALANLCLDSIKLKSGNRIKVSVVDREGSLGTSPPIDVHIENGDTPPPIYKSANDQKQAQSKSSAPDDKFDWKNPNAWIGAIGGLATLGTAVQGVVQGMKPNSSSIQDMAALLTAVNSNNNNNELILQWMQMQQSQRKEDNDRFREMMAELATAFKSDPLAELERVDELRAKLSAKTVTPPPPPVNTGSGGALEKALDIAGKFLDRNGDEPHPPPAPQLTTTGSEVPLPPADDPVVEEEEFEQQPLDSLEPLEQLRQADMAITQNIIDMTQPLMVITDISKLVTWAKDEGLIEHIQEVVEADYQIEQAFELYIRTRSTDPRYTEELLAAAQAFLPLVKDYSLKDEMANESSTVSTDSLHLAEEQPQQAEAV